MRGDLRSISLGRICSLWRWKGSIPTWAGTSHSSSFIRIWPDVGYCIEYGCFCYLLLASLNIFVIVHDCKAGQDFKWFTIASSALVEDKALETCTEFRCQSDIAAEKGSLRSWSVWTYVELCSFEQQCCDLHTPFRHCLFLKKPRCFLRVMSSIGNPKGENLLSEKDQTMFFCCWVFANFSLKDKAAGLKSSPCRGGGCFGLWEAEGISSHRLVFFFI